MTDDLAGLIAALPCGDDDLVLVTPSERLSRRGLLARIDAIASALREAGAGIGTPVAMVVEQSAPAVATMFAVWAVGGVYVPVNGRLTSGEVAGLLEETPVAVVVGSSSAHERLAPGIAQAAIGAVALDPATWQSTVLTPAHPSHPRHDADMALVLRTSGTTGKPKPVLLRHRGVLDSLDSSLRKLRGGDGRPRAAGPLRMSLTPTPLALWAGIYNTIFALRAGFGVVLLDRFSVDEFVAAVREFRITSTVLAPAMIAMLADAEHIADLGPVRHVRSVTSPLSPAVARRFHEKFGVSVLNSYGQTELGGEVVGWTAEDVRTFGLSKLGSVGRPYDNVDLRIADADDNPLPAGEYGEIQVNSPYRMRGYANGDGGAAESERFVDGYLRTGDLGWIDDDGFVWIRGRVSDMINRGGLKVFPDEVEETLRRHPRVSDAAVAGVPDERLGEVPHAWVVCDDDATLGELADWVRETLAPYKVPAGFTRVDAFPRNDVGKVLRRELPRPETSGESWTSR